MKCDLKCITFLVRKSSPSQLPVLQFVSNKALNLFCGKYDFFNFDRFILNLTIASPNNDSVLKRKALAFAYEDLAVYQGDNVATTTMSTAA